MNLNPMTLSEVEFSESVRCLPLVSIDFCIVNDKREILLVKRNNKPAKGYYFNPGGRIKKNESIEKAIERIARVEIGLCGLERSSLEPMGAWDHFYNDSAFSDSISTHYVNLPHYLRISDNQQQQLSIEHGDELQHDSYTWLPLDEAENSGLVHKYSRVYASVLNNKLP